MHDKIVGPRRHIVILQNEGIGAEMHLDGSLGEPFRLKAEIDIEAPADVAYRLIGVVEVKPPSVRWMCSVTR